MLHYNNYNIQYALNGNDYIDLFLESINQIQKLQNNNKMRLKRNISIKGLEKNH